MYEIYTENDDFCHWSLNLLLTVKIVKREYCASECTSSFRKAIDMASVARY